MKRSLGLKKSPIPFINMVQKYFVRPGITEIKVSPIIVCKILKGFRAYLQPPWEKYLKFAIYIVGISSGVRIWELERYITPPATREGQILELTRERWVLEVFRTVIGSLQGVAWMLLVFFLFALIAFVIVRAFELKRQKA